MLGADACKATCGTSMQWQASSRVSELFQAAYGTWIARLKTLPADEKAKE